MDSREGKDNRSKDKRSKMRQHKYKQRPNNENVPSALRAGVIDVADSSDERSVRRGGGGSGWISATVPSQQQRHYSTDPELDFEDDNEENAQLHAGDFDVMSQMPTAVGGTFQFASEKKWDTTEELLDNTEASAYFTLNLKLLNVGLQTIPFYKRMDYASSMFSAEQLQSMDKAAEMAEKSYQNVLREHQSSNPRIKVSSGSKKSSAATVRKADPKVESAAAGAGGPDELDELLSLTNSQVAKVSLVEVPAAVAAGSAAASPANTNKDDIQQWLDNVLDD